MLPNCHLLAQSNKNDDRARREGKIRVFYCRSAASMKSALELVQHNGIISVDARWVLQGSVFVVYLLSGLAKMFLSRRCAPSPRLLSAIWHQTIHNRFYFNIPSTLRLLLEDPEIVKVGMDMVKLQQRFARYLDIRMTGTLDVGSLNASLQSFLSARRKRSRRIDVKTLAKQCCD